MDVLFLFHQWRTSCLHPRRRRILIRGAAGLLKMAGGHFWDAGDEFEPRCPLRVGTSSVSLALARKCAGSHSRRCASFPSHDRCAGSWLGSCRRERLRARRRRIKNRSHGFPWLLFFHFYTDRESASSNPGLCLVRKPTDHSPPKATSRRPRKSSRMAEPVQSTRSSGLQGHSVMSRRWS